MPRIVQFEIAAEDPERAARFYRQALGWVVERPDGTGTHWRVSSASLWQPVHGTIKDGPASDARHVNTIPVPSLDRAIEAVREAGGTVQSDIQKILEVGRFVYARDTEGNVLRLIEEEGRRPAVLGPAKRVL